MGETYDVAVVGTGVISLAVSAELLARGVTVAIVGPGSGDCPGQATRPAGAMLSTFSEIEPRHGTQHTAVQTTERVAAHAMYPTWLERINNDSGARLVAEPGTRVLAPAGRRGHLEPIAAAARAAGHPAEVHNPGQIPGLDPPRTSAGALWLPTEARIDSAALTRSVQVHPHCSWHDMAARSVTAGRLSCADGTEVHAQQVVLAAGTTNRLTTNSYVGLGTAVMLRRPRARFSRLTNDGAVKARCELRQNNTMVGRRKGD